MRFNNITINEYNNIIIFSCYPLVTHKYLNRAAQNSAFTDFLDNLFLFKLLISYYTFSKSLSIFLNSLFADYLRDR